MIATVLSIVLAGVLGVSAHAEGGGGNDARSGRFPPVGVVENLEGSGSIMTNTEGQGHLFIGTAGVRSAAPLAPEPQGSDALQAVAIPGTGGVILSRNLADTDKLDRGHAGLDFLGVVILRDGGSRVLGMAAASITGDEQGLALTVWGLRPAETYVLAIDSRAVGELVASAQGRIQVEYWSRPTGEELQLPDTLVPVSGRRDLELQDSGGATVASGDFQTVPDPVLSTTHTSPKRKRHR